MRVALVHDWLTAMRGGEKCLEVLCRQFPDAEVFTLLRRPGVLSPTIERMQITTSFLQRLPGVSHYYRYLLPLMPRAVESLAIPADVDLVVSFSHAVAKSVKAPPGTPHVCYCFTPMRYAWHLRGDYFGGPSRSKSPGLHRLGDLARAPLHRVRNALLDRVRRWDRDTSDRVTHYIAISRTTAARILECYHRESTIIHPPVDTDFYTPADVRRGDEYLCLSALVPYKRIDLAIETCNRLGRKLAIIGDGPERQRLMRLGGPSVRFLGWRSDREVRDHLRRCRALLFPGHEDFGIVPVEAQACGAPVIAYAKGGAYETILGANEHVVGSGVFFAEQSCQGLAEAMTWFETHAAQCSPVAARLQAEQFNGQRFRREMTGFLAAVMNADESPRRIERPMAA